MPAGALLFLDHTEAGKSTLPQLLADHFPPLADNAIYLIRQEDGAWHVADGSRRAFVGPLTLRLCSGQAEGEMDEREWTPLWAVVRIFQSPTTRLMPITPLVACRHLTDAVFEIDWHECESRPRAGCSPPWPR